VAEGKRERQLLPVLIFCFIFLYVFVWFVCVCVCVCVCGAEDWTQGLTCVQPLCHLTNQTLFFQFVSDSLTLLPRLAQPCPSVSTSWVTGITSMYQHTLFQTAVLKSFICMIWVSNMGKIIRQWNISGCQGLGRRWEW
jgi:hypothetical protein